MWTVFVKQINENDVGRNDNSGRIIKTYYPDIVCNGPRQSIPNKYVTNLGHYNYEQGFGGILRRPKND